MTCNKFWCSPVSEVLAELKRLDLNKYEEIQIDT